MLQDEHTAQRDVRQAQFNLRLRRLGNGNLPLVIQHRR
jgi:hypothetical protein